MKKIFFLALILITGCHNVKGRVIGTYRTFDGIAHVVMTSSGELYANILPYEAYHSNEYIEFDYFILNYRTKNLNAKKYGAENE